MSGVSEQSLQELVDIIVREINPEKIILFGSQVSGNIESSSDVDILVVDPESYSTERRRMNVLGDLLVKLFNFPGPLDILLYSVEEFRAFQKSGNHIVNDACSLGRVLYER